MDSRTREANPPRAVQAGCVGDHTLQSHVLDLNTRLLRMLVRESLGPASWTSLLPGSLAGCLRQLTPDHCALLAHCPVLLVALAPTLGSSCVHDGERDGARVGSEHGDLLSSALVLAWHMAHHRPAAARVLLGWSVEQVRTLTSCSPWGLQSQLLGTSAVLRVRWANRPAVWMPMLAAVLSGDTHRLQRLQARCLQLIAADLERAESLKSPDRSEAIIVDTVLPERPRRVRRVEANDAPVIRRAGAPRALPVNCPE